jgi:hypothetical protein
LYTAPGSAGAQTISATQGAVVGQVSVSITAPTPPPPSGAQPNMSALPVASAQVPNEVAYRALNVPAMAAGQSYLDPISGVRVWKVTSPSIPVANPGAHHDYADGGVQVSRAWGPNGDSHTLLAFADNAGHWLVDFTRGQGLRNWRRPAVGPSGDLNFTFSNNPATPQIAYVFTGSQLVRLNTATNQVANTGNFPKALGSGGWLQQDATDTWFVKGNGTDQVVAWNSQTGQTLTRSFSGLDEPHFDRSGRWVAVIAGGGVVGWDLQANTLTAPMGRGTAPFFHAASVQGLFYSFNSDRSAPWADYRLDFSSGSPVPSYLSGPSVGVFVHGAGQWLQSETGARQFALLSTYNRGAGVPAYSGQAGVMDTRNLLQNAIGFRRLDGSEARYLAGWYGSYDSGDYWALPKATPSPDGKVVLFDSEMLNSGRYDLFLAEVPVR